MPRALLRGCFAAPQDEGSRSEFPPRGHADQKAPRLGRPAVPWHGGRDEKEASTMRHGYRGRRFNRTAEQRKASVANMSAALLKHEQIVTTLPKAKDLRPVVEKLITLGRIDSVHTRRLARAQIRDAEMVKKLFTVLGPRYLP